MEKDYLLKTIECLNDLKNCLNDVDRKGFQDINNNIYSLMFDGSFLKPDFTIWLPNHLNGRFASMMWNISRTGAYFGPNISGYRVEDIKNCLDGIIEVLKKKIPE